MPTFNFLVFLNAYSDAQSSNQPSLSNFRWDREVAGLPISNPTSDAFSLAPGETKTLFNGSRTLAQDGTTQYTLSLKFLSTDTYVLTNVAGTAPNFRTPRAPGADATTALNVTQNGPLLTFASAPSVAASFTGQVAGMTTDVVLTASTAGSAGNSISLAFDGLTTITAAILAWNTANPGNQVTLTSGNGGQTPDNATSITLAGGLSRTPLNLIVGGAVVGDYVRVGSLFNLSNQGEQKIIALTATSFTVENEIGVPEGPITLGSGFASQLQIYSAAGVQVGDTIDITGGFSPVTRGQYKVTSVGANFLEFFSADVLPLEGPITTQLIAVYSAAKQFVYLESNQHVSMTINGVAAGEIKPFVNLSSTQPGVFMRTSTQYSMSVTNNSSDPAKLYLATVE